jgi:hypothetical protein
VVRKKSIRVVFVYVTLFAPWDVANSQGPRLGRNFCAPQALQAPVESVLRKHSRKSVGRVA